MAEKTGVKLVIEKARQAAIDAGASEQTSGKQALADKWGVSYQAIDKFDRQGWMPLARARRASSEFDVPLRDLVRADIREALEA